MKITITRIILEKMLEAGEITIDTFFPQKYSYARISRNLFGLNGAPKATTRTFSAIVSRLKRQGLVTGKRHNGKMLWAVTKEGKRWIKLAYKPIPQLPEKDGIQRLVIFDVPEHERRKRDTLRAELVSYDFRQLQKSVWVGYNPLPEGFLKTLDSLHLGEKVHIFSVQHKGTLES